MKRIFVLHLIANAVLILLVYFWLGIRDARAYQIVLAVVLGAALIAASAWLHAGTWHWMHARDWRVPQRTVLRFTAGFVLFFMALWFLSLIPVDRGALWTASLLTFKSRKPVNPDAVSRTFGGFLWLLKWYLLPIVLLGQWKRPRFWLLFAGLLLACWYVPHRLVHWTPNFKSTAVEVISVLLRWSAAYVLAIAGWLTVLKQCRAMRTHPPTS